MGSVDAEMIVEEGREPGRRYPLSLGQQVVLGRGAEADLRLEDEDASRRHVRVEVLPEGLRVTDLGSKNGTLIDGLPLDANAPLTLREGLLQIGAHKLRLRLAQAPPQQRVR